MTFRLVAAPSAWPWIVVIEEMNCIVNFRVALIPKDRKQSRYVLRKPLRKPLVEPNRYCHRNSADTRCVQLSGREIIRSSFGCISTDTLRM